jgi:hypothetical protein
MAIDPRDTNQLYDEYKGEWELNRDIAEMKLATLRDGTYLEKFGDGSAESEVKAQYDLRKKMSMQTDLAASLREMRVSELWRKNPKRTFEGSSFEDDITGFLNNVDNGGTSMDTFMKRVTEMMLINGVDVLVDSNAGTLSPNSQADENNQPFLSAFSPLERPDWSTDHAGKYWWVRFALGEDATVMEDQDATGVERWVSYDRNFVTVHTLESNEGAQPESESAPHNMGIVPVVQVYWGRSIHDQQQAIATSLMSGLSPIARYMLNLVSQGQLDLYMTVAFFVATGITSEEVGSAMRASMIKAFSDPAADLKPIFANVDHIIEKRDWLNYLNLIMLQKGKVLGLNATAEGRASSGVQVAVEASPLHSELSTTAGILEVAEIEIMRLLVSRKRGEPILTEDLGYSVDYNKIFTLQSNDSLIAEAKALSEVVGSSEVPEMMRVMFRRILSSIAREGSDEHNAALDEIKSFVGDMGGITEPITQLDDGDTEIVEAV